MKFDGISLATAVLGLLAAAPIPVSAGYWLDEIPHVGKSPFHPNASSYKVHRNVKEYGAKGDGVTDDTAAINLAISSGHRCAPRACTESTVSPATVYFPPGTYLVSSPIIDYFYTQLVGDPTDPPTIKAAAHFETKGTLGLLDGNVYGPNGLLAYKAVNVFYRQVRNFIFDTTDIPESAEAYAIHWPSAQATTISNVQFRLAQGEDSKHVGLFIEEGSGGMLTDLVFTGGWKAASLGNQQYTARNWTISNAQIGIEQLWDWGWAYQGLKVNDCPVGIQINDINTGSITLLDSNFFRVHTAIQMGIEQGESKKYPSAGSVIVHNTRFERVYSIVKSPTKVLFAGADKDTVPVTGFALGNIYTPEGPTEMSGERGGYFPELPTLRRMGAIYTRPKPSYEDVDTNDVVTARSYGAKGDGTTDDLAALQKLFDHVGKNPFKIAFVDAGHYVVSNTLVIPPGAKIVGEALSSYIIGHGENFSDAERPRAVIRVGTAGQTGVVEWADTIVSTRGAAAGAKVIEWNLASPSEAPSAMWDVHVRIGGYAGSGHQIADCPVGAKPQAKCIGAHTSMHVTESAANLLMEGTWFWVADHDIEDQEYGQVSVYAGRGVLVEASEGNIWLHGVGSEHHSMYQFQLANTRAIFMGQPQSETPYYQPGPVAPLPMAARSALNDPDFSECADGAGKLDGAPCAMAWGLRIIGSEEVYVYGAGFYSFFNNNSDACAQEDAAVECQSRMVDIQDGKNATSKLVMYNVNTIGSAGMIRRLGVDVAVSAGSASGFADNVALYKHEPGS